MTYATGGEEVLLKHSIELFVWTTILKTIIHKIKSHSITNDWTKEIIERMTGFEREEKIDWEFKLILNESISIKSALTLKG